MTTVYDSNNNEYTVTDGVLTISKGASGTGVMPNFTSSRNLIRTLEISETVTSAIVDSSITIMGNYAFSKQTSLISVTIGATSIGSYAFQYCTSLTSVTIGNSVTSIGSSAFFNCTSLTSVTIGNNVASIGSNAFYYCTSLTSVTIGNNVASIGGSAFFNCTSLTSVTIPDSVTTIGANAFAECTSLGSVILNSVTPATIGTSIFPDNPTTIYVPYGSGDTYKSAWPNYASQIVESEPPTPSESKADIIMQIITGFPTEL